MARRIAHLLEEKENHLKLLRTKDMDVKLERTQEDWKHMFVQESRTPTPEREEILPLNPMKSLHNVKLSCQEEIRMIIERGNQ
jgi:hypothetical protein